MDKRTQSLAYSLVGSSIDFNFQKKVSNATSIMGNVKAAKTRIMRETDEALAVGGELCVMLLAEMTNFYRNEIYYMAVRGCIKMRRFRPAVLSYLELNIQERAERLKGVLSEKLRGDKNRDLKVTALKYFLRTYPNRTKEFKSYLTREEWLRVA